MPTPAWSAGTLFSPGALVRPRSAPAVVQSAPTNPNFEAGASGWTLPTGYVIGQHGHAFDGTWSLEADDTAVAAFTNNNVVPVTPGQVIHASALVNHGAEGAGDARGAVQLYWYDAAMVYLSASEGNQVASGAVDDWHLSSVTGTAPASAAFCALGGFMLTDGDPIWMDYFTWDYSYSNAPAGLIFRATQPASGFSGAAEPTWPAAVGLQVTDNEVIWEGVLTSRVTYAARPILRSGATEPAFSGAVGGVSALDGTILWQGTSRQITDAKCPHSKVVAIAASKVFAGNGDIVPFSATGNALDWSTVEDAGFLPFGLQTYGSNPVAALGLYRSNLVAFNAAGAQMWQVDEDPVNMALLDAVPVPCTYHKSIAPVANDLALLTSLGVRNLTIAAASTNLQAGEFGKAIDPLVKVAIAAGQRPIGLYYPGSGQYLLFFGSEAFVFTLNGGGKAVSRSRYVFPAAITDWTVLDNDLYLRAGDLVWRFDEDALADDRGAGSVSFHFTAQLVAGAAPIGYARDDFDATVKGSVSADYAGVGPFVFHLLDSLAGVGARVKFGLAAAAAFEEDAFTHIEVVIEATTYTLQRADATVDAQEDEDSTASRYRRYWTWAGEELPLVSGEEYELTVYGIGVGFTGYLAWPYLELQALGSQVMLHGFDLVGVGEVDVQFGYNQKDFTQVTDSYVVDAETLPGMPIAMPISAPSVQLRLTFSANQAWSWNAARLYDSPVTG